MNARASLVGVMLAVASSVGVAVAAAPAMQVPRLQVPRMTTVSPSVDAERLRVVQEATAGKLDVRDLTALADPVRLDVRRGLVAGEARLTFESAYQVSPEANQADFALVPGQTPRLRIEFKAPAPGMYVLEAVIRGGVDHGGVPAGNIELQSLGGARTSATLQYGKEQRVALLVEATSAGWQTVLLQSRDGHWSFRSVDISRFR